MKKVKVSELEGAALNWAVAKCEGRALRKPVLGTDEEAAQKLLPFEMFEVVATEKAGFATYRIESVEVTRFDISPRCVAPSIDFIDFSGRRARGSVDLFYFDRAEAELECQAARFGSINGFLPTTKWADGGPIIEREGIHWGMSEADGFKNYIASIFKTHAKPQTGKTPLIAAMRCYVASKLSDEIEIPEGLL